MNPMMRTALVLLATTATLVAVEPFDFRQTKWGFSRDQVIAAEGKPAMDTPDRIGYQTQLVGRNVALVYHFTGGKLTSAGYALLDKFVEPSAYQAISGVWVDKLTEKYGEGKKTVKWFNDLYRSDPNKHAFAISAGHVIVNWEWVTPTTTVSHTLTGENFKVIMGIRYESRDTQKLVDSEQKAKDKSVF